MGWPDTLPGAALFISPVAVESFQAGQDAAAVRWVGTGGCTRLLLQGQHGRHSSQTPEAAFGEMILFSCLSCPMSLVPPTALLKEHITSKLFPLFSLKSQKQMEAQHLGWCWG